MKKAFILVLVILFTGLFTIACESSNGENEKKSTLPQEVEFSEEWWANQIFNDLSEDVKKQIIPDFLEAAERGFIQRYWMYNFVDTRNGWAVIGEFCASDVLGAPLFIDGTWYILPLHNMYVWKDDENPVNNNFYTLQEACDLGFLTLNDLYGITAGDFKYE